ncbi:unnamed protein product [Spodoptera littoralis]|uniref:Uncharacterized protein n=1 Tax=Spodoptera littoralis TaxID=7109 RepID=A0A9P0IBR9_SPOLI|nr:unnamed protein product [Spodoptera littoralis]CAH1644018.1 unnamed protein product [Spodoptera littoralis]
MSLFQFMRSLGAGWQQRAAERQRRRALRTAPQHRHATSQHTHHSFLTMSNLDLRSMGTFLGSNFFLAARCARISAAVICRLSRGGSVACALSVAAASGASGAGTSRSGTGSPGAGATTSSSASSGRSLMRATTCLWLSPAILCPFTSRMRSPRFRPACSAGEPSSTLPMNWPGLPFSACRLNP